MNIQLQDRNTASERGNVLFYVLIAVTLLAALSYAVTDSSRGNVQQLSNDKARLYATEIIEYSSSVSAGVGQLRLRGVSAENICFESDTWPAGNDYSHSGCNDNTNRVFHPDGAGINLAFPPAEAMDQSATPDGLWHFYGQNEIENVGSTCGAAGCSDLIMVVDEVMVSVCVQLNDLLGITNPSGVPPTDDNIDTTLFQGSYGYARTIGDEAGSAPLASNTSGCFQKTNAPAEYIYYKVLIVR